MMRKIISFSPLLFFIVLLPLLEPALALGNGWCHWFGGLNNSAVKYVYPAGELAWKVLEPTEGKYDFSVIDSMVQKARSAKKKLHIQFYVSNPDAKYNKFVPIPQWAIDKGMHVYYVEDSQHNKYPAGPIQWDPIYLDLHEKLIKAFAARYEKPEYYDVIEAVVMQSGGNWGEMALPGEYDVGAGSKADVLDPNNLFVKEMARVYLGSEDKSSEIARIDGNHWEFDDYFIRAVKEIIDVYGRSLSYYPFAIQLGFGLSGQRRVAQEAVEYGLSKYKNHMWIRYAWWGSFGAGNSNPNAQDFWGRYQNQTVSIAEVGHPSWWCAAEGGYEKGGCYECCQWNTRAEAIQHNQNFITEAINSGVVATCFQDVFYNNLDKYPLSFPELQSKLEGVMNKRASLLNLTPFPTSPIPNISIPPTLTEAPKNPDVDKDGRVTLTDYYYVLINKYLGVLPLSYSGDVNKDGKINDGDLAFIIRELKK